MIMLADEVYSGFQESGRQVEQLSTLCNFQERRLRTGISKWKSGGRSWAGSIGHTGPSEAEDPAPDLGGSTPLPARLPGVPLLLGGWQPRPQPPPSGKSSTAYQKTFGLGRPLAALSLTESARVKSQERDATQRSKAVPGEAEAERGRGQGSRGHGGEGKVAAATLAAAWRHGRNGTRGRHGKGLRLRPLRRDGRTSGDLSLLRARAPRRGSGAADTGTLTARAPPLRGSPPPSARPPPRPARLGAWATSQARALSARRQRRRRGIASSASRFPWRQSRPGRPRRGNYDSGDPGEAKMPSKGKDKKKGKSKGKDTKKLIKTDESVVDRAKANASLWEARLEVTELSRIKYRDTSRILAKSNEDLKKKQCKMEKDIMSVLSYLKKQDQEKDNMIEKLKQQLNETKEKAQEEKDKLEQKYTRQINELEGQFHQKAKEIGMIHTELKAVRQFQKRKIQVERELDDLKENLRNTERIHQETLRRLESRFFEEKVQIIRVNLKCFVY
nr:guanine nucleotide-binding protein G(s) subunit alpha isoforms XLas-like [Gorilla gorilla gorilla]